MTAERCTCARARGLRRGTYRETLLQTLLNGYNRLERLIIRQGFWETVNYPAGILGNG
jgi:hypothetical protein